MLLTCLTVALVVSLIAGTALGGARIPLADTLRYLAAALAGGYIDPADVSAYRIVWEIRAPRTLLAALVGAGLSACGVVIQSLVRNVLADPFMLGVSAGASVGAVSTTIILAGFSSLSVAALVATWSASLVILGAFIGALLSCLLVWLAARGVAGAVSPVRLVLTGVVVAAGLEAAMSVLIHLVPGTEATSTILFWTMGSFGAAAWGLLPPVAIISLICLLIFLRRASVLDVLSQGDETAVGLGVNPTVARRRLFIVVSLAAAAATATCGAIGFTGLVVPHVVRMVVGATHRRVLRIAPLVGGIFMVWVDILARSVVPPRELPLSAITALLGVPVFVWLLRSRGQVLGA